MKKAKSPLDKKLLLFLPKIEPSPNKIFKSEILTKQQNIVAKPILTTHFNFRKKSVPADVSQKTPNSDIISQFQPQLAPMSLKKKRKFIDDSASQTKDVIKLAQVDLLRQIPRFSSLFATKEMKQNHSCTFTRASSQGLSGMMNLKLSKRVANFTKNKLRSSSDNIKHLGQQVDLKFKVNFSVDNFIQRHNIPNIYFPKKSKKSLRFQDNIISSFSPTLKNEIIDCDELIKNFDEAVKDNTDTLVLKTIISHFDTKK